MYLRAFSYIFLSEPFSLGSMLTLFLEWQPVQQDQQRKGEGQTVFFMIGSIALI